METSFTPLPASKACGGATISKPLSNFQATLRELARRYAKLGYAVIPVIDKRPLVEWRAFQSQVPSNAERTRQPWEQANGIGLVIGEKPTDCDRYLFVMDIEQHHRAQAEEWLDYELSGWRSTLTAKSGSGGLHLYCSAQAPVKTQKSRWGDVLGTNSLVILPPSKAAHGTYDWMSVNCPLEVELSSYSSILEGTARIHNGNGTNQPREGVKTKLGATVSSLANSDDSVRKILKRLGIDPKHWGDGKGSSFLCPMCEEEHPSASLFRADSGCVVLRCWHAGKEECPAEPYVLLPSVYSYLVTREFKRLRRGELAAWSLRLLIDAGVINNTGPKLSLGPMSRVGRILVTAIAEIQDLSRQLLGTDGPVAFTRDFAMAWCSFSSTELAKAWDEVKRLGLVSIQGKSARIILWAVNVAKRRPTGGLPRYRETPDIGPHNSLCSSPQVSSSNRRDGKVSAGGEPEI